MLYEHRNIRQVFQTKLRNVLNKKWLIRGLKECLVHHNIHSSWNYDSPKALGPANPHSFLPIMMEIWLTEQFSLCYIHVGNLMFNICFMLIGWCALTRPYMAYQSAWAEEQVLFPHIPSSHLLRIRQSMATARNSFLGYGPDWLLWDIIMINLLLSFSQFVAN